MTRLMMIGLDGFEMSIAEAMIAAGELPALARLRKTSAIAALDHGDARLTGLAWEHVSTGLSPQDSGKWAAVHFDPGQYSAVQATTRLQPFVAALDTPSLIFDVPYFDLARAPSARGLVGWGVHDPGVALTARPDGLTEELIARFGRHPAERWVYGLVWPDPEKTVEMGKRLADAVDVRFAATEWLFAERFKDWRLGMMVMSESHSAIEAMWHGIDPAHPLHSHASSASARRALEDVYRAADRGIARLIERLPDTLFVLFNLHGMGPNEADPASMVLLPELMFRRSFGRPLLKQREWPRNGDGLPLLAPGESWEASMMAQLPLQLRARNLVSRIAARLGLSKPLSDGDLSLAWMPAERYAPFWSRMEAFAIPAFYDGQIRINLRGREKRGLVEPADYQALCEKLESELQACIDPRTGKAAVARVERSSGAPLERRPSEADLKVIWNGSPLALSHPEIGSVGPIPYRRTGGHTGGDGFAWFSGPGIAAGDFGRRSSFDVVPTAIDLMGLPPLAISGTSFADEMAPTSRPVSAREVAD